MESINFKVILIFKGDKDDVFNAKDCHNASIGNLLGFKFKGELSNWEPLRGEVILD